MVPTRVLAAAALLTTTLALSGCTRLYQITFTHGSVVTVRGKPKYDKNTDTFTVTDMGGHTGRVPAISIREIAPASTGSSAAAAQPFKTSR